MGKIIFLTMGMFCCAHGATSVIYDTIMGGRTTFDSQAGDGLSTDMLAMRMPFDSFSQSWPRSYYTISNFNRVSGRQVKFNEAPSLRDAGQTTGGGVAARSPEEPAIFTFQEPIYGFGAEVYNWGNVFPLARSIHSNSLRSDSLVVSLDDRPPITIKTINDIKEVPETVNQSTWCFAGVFSDEPFYKIKIYSSLESSGISLASSDIFRVGGTVRWSTVQWTTTPPWDVLSQRDKNGVGFLPSGAPLQSLNILDQVLTADTLGENSGQTAVASFFSRGLLPTGVPTTHWKKPSSTRYGPFTLSLLPFGSWGKTKDLRSSHGGGLATLTWKKGLLSLGFLGGYGVGRDYLKNPTDESDLGEKNISTSYVGSLVSLGEKFWFKAIGIVGIDRHKQKRMVTSGFLAHNTHKGSSLSTLVQLGGTLSLAQKTFLSPFLSFSFVQNKEKGYTEENGDLYTLTVGKRTNTFLREEVGLKITSGLEVKGTAQVSFLRKHPSKKSRTYTQYRTAYPQVPLSIIFRQKAQWAIAPQLALAFSFNDPSWLIHLVVRGELARKENSFKAMMELSKKF